MTIDFQVKAAESEYPDYLELRFRSIYVDEAVRRFVLHSQIDTQ